MDSSSGDDVERAWTLMEKIGFAMVTLDGERLRSRPMQRTKD